MSFVALLSQGREFPLCVLFPFRLPSTARWFSRAEDQRRAGVIKMAPHVTEDPVVKIFVSHSLSHFYLLHIMSLTALPQAPLVLTGPT